ncbi:MAG: hypothetical protein QW757_03770 [Candidatus Woesearchaeota archaeon]
MDSFYVYLKKQLLNYVEAEHKKGIPLEVIENNLLNAGHDKNIIDEVLIEIKKEEKGKKVVESKDPVKKELNSNLKESIVNFFGKEKINNEKKKEEVKKEIEEIKEKSDNIINEVIEEAEVIEEQKILEGIAFFIYLILLGIIIVLIAGYSNSEIVNVFFGFLPTIINSFVSLYLVFLSDNLPLYMIIPLLISGLFYVIGKFANLSLFSGMTLEPLASINFIFSFIYNFLLTYVRSVKPNFMKKRIVKKNLINKNEKGKEKIDEKKEEIKHEVKSNVNETNINQNNIKFDNIYSHKERKEISDLKKEFNIK